MLHKIIKIENGDVLAPYKIFKCDACGKRIEESWPRYEDGNFHLCPKCAFMQGFYNGKKYLKSIGLDLDSMHVGINLNNGIEIWTGKSAPPWERTSKQQRRSPQYANWRNKVFERDDYTCQKCNQRGGNLNAHHIKPFKKYEKLRHNVDNGITLCEKCHRSTHSRGGIR